MEEAPDNLKPTPDYPFIIIDADVESAGSTLLFRAEDSFLRNRNYLSLQYYMRNKVKLDGNEQERKRIFLSYMCPVGEFFGLKSGKNSILLVGANMDKNTDKIDKAGNDPEQRDRFWDFIEQCEDFGARGIFFDTPSGTQGLARFSRDNSKTVVCCMRPTYQFRRGTKFALRAFQKQGGQPVTYILTPTTVCVDSGQVFNGKVYPGEALAQIRKDFNTDEFNSQVKFDMLEPTPTDCKEFPDISEDGANVFGIPEIKRFKWSEDCLSTIAPENLTSNDMLGINRFKYLARTILKY